MMNQQCGSRCGAVRDNSLSVMVEAEAQTPGTTYCPDRALKNGTLFPVLFKPMNGEMHEDPNNIDRKQAKSFALWELRLYLDTHPEDKEALALLRQLDSQTCQPNYATSFVPCVSACNTENQTSRCNWCWLDNPWPWEKECCQHPCLENNENTTRRRCCQNGGNWSWNVTRSSGCGNCNGDCDTCNTCQRGNDCDCNDDCDNCNSRQRCNDCDCNDDCDNCNTRQRSNDCDCNDDCDNCNTRQRSNDCDCNDDCDNCNTRQRCNDCDCNDDCNTYTTRQRCNDCDCNDDCNTYTIRQRCNDCDCNDNCDTYTTRQRCNNCDCNNNCDTYTTRQRCNNCDCNDDCDTYTTRQRCNDCGTCRTRQHDCDSNTCATRQRNSRCCNRETLRYGIIDDPVAQAARTNNQTTFQIIDRPCNR